MRSRDGSRGRVPGTAHDRLAVPAAAVATLLLIVVPYATAGGGGGAHGPEDLLTPVAQRALAELPHAYHHSGRVVVPAVTDPAVAWTGDVPPDRVDGEVVELGVRGLVKHGYLPISRSAPLWVEELREDDAVLHDVGPLSFACMRWPGSATCVGALLMRRQGEHHLLRSGLAVPGRLDAVVGFPVLGLDARTMVVVGTAPPGTAGVRLSFADGEEVHGRVSSPGAVSGATLWWGTVDQRPGAVTFLDTSGEALSEHRLD